MHALDTPIGKILAWIVIFACRFAVTYCQPASFDVHISALTEREKEECRLKDKVKVTRTESGEEVAKI